MKNKFFSFILVFALLSIPQYALAAFQCGCTACIGSVFNCSEECASCSESQIDPTKENFSAELNDHKTWMVDLFFNDPAAGDKPGLLAAMKLMTAQLTANSILQVEIIGSFFDAKHQLETQRLFQTLTAQAHKDYQPSEELCTVGSVTRSLASSERKSNLTSAIFSKRSIDRQLLAKDTLGTEFGSATDERSRLVQFIRKFCNPNDNAGNLKLLCKKANAPVANRNKDINYTSNLDLPLTLNIDPSDPDITSDEEAFFALTANLFAHQAMPRATAEKLIAQDAEGELHNASGPYLDSRALVAKRSVAANSLASIMSMKASGNNESQPFIYAVINELSPKLSTQNIEDFIGKNPSYYAQMEVLTKKLYQSPNFYSDLYDKPANVLRKDVAIQAADLMQKRDIFRSLLRSEAVLAVMLETALLKEQDKITNEAVPLRESNNNVTALEP